MNKKGFFRKNKNCIFIFFQPQKQNLISAVIFQSDYKLLKPKQKTVISYFNLKPKQKNYTSVERFSFNLSSLSYFISKHLSLLSSSSVREKSPEGSSMASSSFRH